MIDPAKRQESLKPCPFCGDQGQPALLQGGGVEWAQVECVNHDCGAIGPTSATEAQAIAAWNTRASEPNTASQSWITPDEEAELVGRINGNFYLQPDSQPKAPTVSINAVEAGAEVLRGIVREGNEGELALRVYLAMLNTATPERVEEGPTDPERIYHYRISKLDEEARNAVVRVLSVAADLEQDGDRVRAERLAGFVRPLGNLLLEEGIAEKALTQSDNTTDNGGGR